MQRLTKLYGNNAYGLVNVRDDEQEVDSPYPNTLKAILQSFARLGELEDILYAPDGSERITLDRLRELVTAEGEGRVVVLPCKVGGTVYALNRTTMKIIECDVSYIEIDGTPLIHVFYESEDVCMECEGCPFLSWSQNLPDGDWSCGGESGEYVFKPDDFGKTVFLTRAEAEKGVTHDH